MEKAITNKKIQEEYRKRFPDYFIHQAREQNKKIKKAKALYEKNVQKQKDIKYFPGINKTDTEVGRTGSGMLGVLFSPIIAGVKGIQSVKTRLSKKKLKTAIKEKEALWKLIK